jgi:S1-C subfamily serine protease
MEDLNKQQLILLVLLVSFVTSIATGIITFSLLQDAPVAVTQNINRIVERTVERVVPDGGGGVVVKEITTVVSEEDSVLDSVDKNLKSMVRLKTLGADGKEMYKGIGVVLSDSGIIVAHQSNFGSGNYSVVFYDNAVYNVSKSFSDQNSNFVFLKLGKPITDSYKFHAVKLGSSESLKLGQSVIAISGLERNTVSVGRIVDILRSAENMVKEIYTDLNPEISNPGSPILNLSGELVGLEAVFFSEATRLSYYPVQMLKNSLETALSALAK